MDSPIAINGLPIEAGEFRRGMVSATLAHDRDLVTARPGCLLGFSASVTPTGVRLADGIAVINPETGSRGSYIAHVDAGDHTVRARDGAYTRFDVLYLQIGENAVDGRGFDGVKVGMAIGTPALAPVEPAVPTGALPLYRVIVPTSGAITLLDKRVWTAGFPSTIPYRGSRPAGAALRPGQMCMDMDSNEMYVWGGSAGWLAMDLGATLVTSPGGGAIRWPNGMQIVWLELVWSDVAIDQAYGSLFIGSRGWRFQLPFADVPSVTVGRAQWGTSASWGGVATLSTTHCYMRFYDCYSRARGTETKVSATAVGRWK